MFLTREEIENEKIALIDDLGMRVSYGQLRDDCEKMATSIGSRNVVLLISDYTIETVRFYYAVMGSSNVPLLIDEKMNNEFIIDYYELYHPQYIWINKKLYGTISKIGIIICETDGHFLIKTDLEKYDIYPELAILLTTSGSTGSPKTVRISKRNLIDNARATVDALKLQENDKGILTLPMSYTYGMTICHMAFCKGATLLITQKSIISREYEEFITREGVTLLHGVPYVYEMFERIGFLDRLPDSLRAMTMGGGRAKEDLHLKMNRIVQEKKISLFALYGQTEGTCILTKLLDTNKKNEPGCIGVACLGMKAYLSDEDELVFEGTSVSLGYANGWEDLSNGDDNKGVLYTGDIARIDKLGQIYLCGRKKRFLKLLGKRISLDDIENKLEKELNIEGVCAGNDSGICIYVKKGTSIGTDELRKIIAHKYTISLSLIIVKFIDEIQRNSQGKIDYGKLE